MQKILLLLFVCCCLLSFGGEKYDCIYNKNSKIVWTQKYPFINAEKIIWVSWKSVEKGMPKTIKDFTRDKIHWEIFSDSVSINSTNVTKLTDILFNYNYSVKGNYDLSSKCYNPRDAILFLDKNGNLIDYVEMCFECTDYRLMTTKWKFDFCEGKLDLLKKYKALLFKK
jgi:hypothetical protein